MMTVEKERSTPRFWPSQWRQQCEQPYRQLRLKQIQLLLGYITAILRTSNRHRGKPRLGSSKLRKRLKCKKTLGGRTVGRLILCNLSGNRDRCDIGARRSPREKMIMLLKTPWGHPFPVRFFCSSTKVSGNRHACQKKKAKAKHNDTGRSRHSDRSVSYSKNNKLQWLFNINKTDTFIGWVWSAWRQH